MRLPADVRGHHARADHRRVRRADEVRRLRRCSSRCGRPSCTRPWRTGSGAAACLGSAGLGALDFAGGTVVHITRASAALAAALCIGQAARLRPTSAMRPHNVPMTLLGRRAAVVRLVRVQRRQRASAANGLAVAARSSTTHLGAAGGDARMARCSSGSRHGQADALGAAIGCGRRAGRDHPGRRVRRAAAGARDRPASPASCASRRSS